MDERTRHASFSTEDEPRDPVSFDIDGEQFDCHPHIPGDSLLHYLDLLTPKGAEKTVALCRDDLWEFFAEAMDDSELERFQKFVHDPGRFVKLELLAAIMGHLLQSYTGGGTDPTARRSRSARGRPPTGRGSAASS